MAAIPLRCLHGLGTQMVDVGLFNRGLLQTVVPLFSTLD